MNLIEFKRALRQLVDMSIKDRYDKPKFIREMSKIAESYLGKEIIKNQILNEIVKEYDFANINTVLKTEKDITDQLFTTLEPSFAKTKNGIITRVANLVNEGIKKNEFSKVMQLKLEGIIGTYRNYAATIINTGLAGYDNLSKHKDDPPDSIYRYTGTAPQRPFCRSIIGKEFTRKQIDRLSNGQGLDVWTYCGGFRCRHFWLLVK